MTKTKEHNYILQENILNIVHRCKNTHIYKVRRAAHHVYK